MGFCLPPPVTAQDLQGLQSFRLLGPRFDHLHTVGTERDRAGNRPLCYAQDATLLLLDFFNPTVTSVGWTAVVERTHQRHAVLQRQRVTCQCPTATRQRRQACTERGRQPLDSGGVDHPGPW